MMKIVPVQTKIKFDMLRISSLTGRIKRYLQTRKAKKLKKAFKDDDRVPDEVLGAFLARLDEVRVWRNALCHGAWQGFREDGTVGLRCFRRGDEGPERLEDRLSVETLSSIRAATVDLTADLADILSAAGARFPGTALPGAVVTDYSRYDRD